MLLTNQVLEVVISVMSGRLIFLVFSILVAVQEIKKTEIIIFLLGRDQAYLDLCGIAKRGCRVSDDLRIFNIA